MTYTRRTLLVLSASLIITTGCHKKSSGINPNSLGPVSDTSIPSPTASLTADPTAVDLGGSVVLNWRTTGASAVTIDGIGTVNANGTQTVTPSNSTNFHLTAKGNGYSTEANVRVTVRVPVAPTTAGDASSSGRPGGDMGSEAAFQAAVQDAFFDYDSYELRPDAQSAAQSAAKYLNAHPSIRIVIGGYSDSRGSAEYNLALGENRANAARTALVAAGVAASRLRVISYGNEKQFCNEENENCWQENRRAQFSFDR